MKILFVSLGCDKNLVDTEMMLGELLKKGYEFTDDESEADIYVQFDKAKTEYAQKILDKENHK